jgi:hypothetical protein
VEAILEINKMCITKIIEKPQSTDGR